MLASVERIGLAYIDGNHQYQPTVDYVDMILKKCDADSILILDDIYWSAEMTAAWEYVKAHPSTKVTIDLYRLGIVFFRKENYEKEHFQLYF